MTTVRDQSRVILDANRSSYGLTGLGVILMLMAVVTFTGGLMFYLPDSDQHDANLWACTLAGLLELSFSITCFVWSLRRQLAILTEPAVRQAQGDPANPNQP